MSVLANALPENTGDGYVAAAYIVFFVLLLVYVAIMALRLSHVQRDLRDLQARTQESAREHETRQGSGAGSSDVGSSDAESGAGAAAGRPQSHDDETLEREPA
ncbi:MAG TPA: hypothetical protein VGH60_01105 [Solirubrobacteraceae bacterium]|jgi:hypothetical protein